MTERLTERDCNGVVGFKGLMRYYNFNDFQKMAKKLLYYEDLEERCLEEYSFGFRTLMWKWSAFYKDIDKFIKWRDLEEQGRLHIVPKEFWDMNMEYLIKDVCPFDYGLVGLNEADCKADDVRCKECWGKALKGE